MIQEYVPVHPEMTLTATLVDGLIDAFNREEIVYCHWKSNIELGQATAGKMDLDLLVDRKSLPQALAILSRLGFKAAVARWGANSPSISHYYGLDPDTKGLIHVHLFSKVLTGESYVKSHLFPFEAMLLENAYHSDRIRVTSKSAELVLSTLRTFVKYGSLLDLVSLRKKSERLKVEVRWLQDGGHLPKALSLLERYCPVIDEHLFVECVDTLNSDRPLIKRLILAQQVRRRLKVYAKHTFFKRLLAYGQVLWAEVQRRLGTKQKNRVFQAGGAVIAFVGADATGKSTLVTETGRWLGAVFTTSVVHTGKPPSSWLTLPVNILLRLARNQTAPGRTALSKTQAPASDPDHSPRTSIGVSALPYAFRSVALAWDRRRLAGKVRRRAANGEIVVCDRYPSRVVGAMDSPRLQEIPLKKGLATTFYNKLARLEARLYRQIPPPDVVLKLRVSLETAKKRNRERDGQDGDVYLEARHRQSQDWHMPGTRYVYDIDTEQTLEATIRHVKEAIWESL